MPKAKVLLSEACLAHYSIKEERSEGTRTRSRSKRRTSTQYPLLHRPYSIWIKNSPRSFKTGFVLRCMCSECIDDIVAFKSAVSVAALNVVSNKSTRVLLRHARMTYSTRSLVLVHLYRPAPLTSPGHRGRIKGQPLAQLGAQQVSKACPKVIHWSSTLKDVLLVLCLPRKEVSPKLVRPVVEPI